jgi:hypothetical protein
MSVNESNCYVAGAPRSSSGLPHPYPHHGDHADAKARDERENHEHVAIIIIRVEPEQLRFPTNVRISGFGRHGKWMGGGNQKTHDLHDERGRDAHGHARKRVAYLEPRVDLVHRERLEGVLERAHPLQPPQYLRDRVEVDEEPGKGHLV